MLPTAGNHTLEQIMSVIKTIIMKTNYNYGNFLLILLKPATIT